MRQGFHIIILLGLIAGSCTGNPKQVNTKALKQFSLPAIPAIMNDRQQQLDYLAMHYWDNFDFNDTSLINSSLITEQVFTNYIQSLLQAGAPTTALSVRHMLERALPNPQLSTCFMELLEKYLYDPNSPLRNEEIYSIALEYVLASPQVDEVNKIRPRYQLEQLRKNPPGQIAVDFVYTLANGKQGRMHHIKSDFLILFFNNPDCTACGDIQRGFEQSPVISQMQETGRLKILAMYIDEAIDAWRQYQTKIPAQWINGYDASFVILNKELYDLRAIPNLYLLDKDKRVILKDAQPELLERYLLMQGE